jgi:hypothetical protein
VRGHRRRSGVLYCAVARPLADVSRCAISSCSGHRDRPMALLSTSHSPWGAFMDSEGAPLRPDLMQQPRRRECGSVRTECLFNHSIAALPPSLCCLIAPLPRLQLGTGRPACWASSWWLLASCWSLCSWVSRAVVSIRVWRRVHSFARTSQQSPPVPPPSQYLRPPGHRPLRLKSLARMHTCRPAAAAEE